MSQDPLSIRLVAVNESMDEELFLQCWTYTSRLLFYSVILVSLISLPALIISLLHLQYCQKSNYIPYLSAILIANIIMIGTLFGGVIIENTDMVYNVIPGSIICKTTAFMVNTSSCFMYWTWVAMYAERFIHVFYPLRANRKPRRWVVILISILIGSAIIQIWTPIFITGKSLDLDMDSSSHLNSIYCGAESNYSGETKLIMVIECILTFFIPMLLTVFADISVLVCNRSCSEHFTLVTSQEIGNNVKRKKSYMKIVSIDMWKTSKKIRATAIRRCLISATFTLFLNLPNYCLQLLDEFFSLHDHSSIEIRRLFLKIDAAVYILYLLQFPLSPIHIYMLTRRTKVPNSRIPGQSQRVPSMASKI